MNAAWRSSMEVGVRVDPRTSQRQASTRSTAYLTMVALDDEGQPTEVPPIEAGTPDEQRRDREAQLRRDNRLAERQGRGGARPDRMHVAGAARGRRVAASLVSGRDEQRARQVEGVDRRADAHEQQRGGQVGDQQVLGHVRGEQLLAEAVDAGDEQPDGR